VRARDVQLGVVVVGVDEHLEELPVVPVEVRRELVEHRVEPELDDRERRVLVLEDVVERSRLRRVVAATVLDVPVQGVETVDDGVPVALALVGARVGREPSLALVEVQRRREPLGEFLGAVGVDGRGVAVRRRLEELTPRERRRRATGDARQHRSSPKRRIVVAHLATRRPSPRAVRSVGTRRPSPVAALSFSSS